MRLPVTIDGRCLTPGENGTKVHTLELACALAAHPRLRVRVVLPVDPSDEARARLAGTATVVAHERFRPDALVHRPYQVSSPEDLRFLRRMGLRHVVTQQDLINYEGLELFAERAEWTAHRALTRTALARCDRVVAFSHTVGRALLREDLVPRRRLAVVPIGVDHALVPPPTPVRPAGVPDRFLLCLAPELPHKNRPFALELAAALRRGHGYPGGVVLAGAPIAHGSSRAAEDALLAADPDLAAATVRQGPVDAAGKAWLLAHADAVLVPSRTEGFGLVPFEAAAAGTPCAYAAVSAHAELLPAGEAVIVPWDAAASAARLHDLLSAPDRREAHLRALRAAASRLTWAQTAQRLAGVYARTLATPPPAARVRAELAAAARRTL